MMESSNLSDEKSFVQNMETSLVGFGKVVTAVDNYWGGQLHECSPVLALHHSVVSQPVLLSVSGYVV